MCILDTCGISKANVELEDMDEPNRKKKPKQYKRKGKTKTKQQNEERDHRKILEYPGSLNGTHVNSIIYSFYLILP